MAINIETTSGYPNNTRGTMRVASSGASADGVYFIADSAGVLWERIVDSSEYSCRWAKIFGDGTNYLSELQTVLDHSDVTTVVFDLIGGGDITLTGTLNCGSKRLKFQNGTKITGTCTLSEAIIEADYQNQIFENTVTLDNCSATSEYFSVRWYDVQTVIEGNTNCAAGIQKAVDMVIANPGLPRTIYFPKAMGTNTVYQISSEIICYNWSGAIYSYFTIHLKGDETSRFSDSGNSVKLNYTGLETFAIGLQRGLSCNITGLWINGPFTRGFSNYTQFAQTTYATYVTGAGLGVRDNGTSPCAGIVIDPFTNGLGTAPSAPNRYPGLDAYYRGDEGISGSSAINIKDCRIMGFTVDVMYAPNGYTLNCESMVLENCALDVCKAAVAYGQAQCKGNVIRDCIHIDRVHTVVDCYTYGTSLGAPPHWYGGTIAGLVNRFCLISAVGYYGLYVKDLFSESLFRIGVCNTSIANSFIDCKIEFASTTVTDQVPDTYYTGTQTLFENCLIRSYNANYRQRQNFEGADHQFVNCTLSRPPLKKRRDDNTGNELGDYKNCITLFDNGTIGPPNGIVSTNASSRNYYMYGRFKTRSYNTVQFGYIDYEYDAAHIDNLVGSYSVTIGSIASDRTASITLPSGLRLYTQVNDYLVDLSGVVTYYDTLPSGTNNYAPLGRITAINNSTGAATLSEIPINITAATYGTVYLVYDRKIQVPFTGDIANGSAVITNVRVQGGVYPAAGDRIEIWGVATGSLGLFVVSVDSSAKTVTCNDTFFANRTKVDFIMGDPNICVYSRYALGEAGNPWLYKGTKWKVLNTADSGRPVLNREFLVMQSGYPSYVTAGETSAYQASWGKLSFERSTNVLTLSTENAANLELIIEPETMITQIVINAASNIAALNIGTSASGSDIVSGYAYFTASGYDTITINKYSNTSITLYFSGNIIGTTLIPIDVIVYKK